MYSLTCDTCNQSKRYRNVLHQTCDTILKYNHNQRNYFVNYEKLINQGNNLTVQSYNVMAALQSSESSRHYYLQEKNWPLKFKMIITLYNYAINNRRPFTNHI